MDFAAAHGLLDGIACERGHCFCLRSRAIVLGRGVLVQSSPRTGIRDNTGAQSMMKAFVTTCLFATCFTLVPSIAHAQERVHALSGTVTSINPKIQMIEVATDDGSPGHFRWMKNPTSID